MCGSRIVGSCERFCGSSGRAPQELKALLEFSAGQPPATSSCMGDSVDAEKAYASSAVGRPRCRPNLLAWSFHQVYGSVSVHRLQVSCPDSWPWLNVDPFCPRLHKRMKPVLQASHPTD